MDKILVQKILRGDTRAFRQLYDKYFPKIYTMVGRRVERKEDTEDIVQETFTNIIESLERYNSKYAFSTWIYTITRNKVNDFWRKKYSSNEVVLDEKIEIAESFEEESIESNIAYILDLVDEKSQMLLRLRYEKKFKFIDIAQELGITLNNTKVRHNRILKKLRKLLENEN